MGGNIIPQKPVVRYLGMYLDANLNWNQHIKWIIDKAQKRLNVLKAFFRTW